jgi:hypothetical protein
MKSNALGRFVSQSAWQIPKAGEKILVLRGALYEVTPTSFPQDGDPTHLARPPPRRQRLCGNWHYR